MTRGFVKLAFVAAALGASFAARMELTVGGEFEVYPIHNADVRARVDGLIDTVLVDEGEMVEQGQVLVRLSDRKHLADLAKIEAQLRQQEARLAELKAGARREEIALAEEEIATAQTRARHARARYREARARKVERLAQARSMITKARERLRLAENERDRFEVLRRDNIVSKRRFEQIAQQVAVRQAELEAAQAELNLITADVLAELEEAVAISAKRLKEAAARLALVRAGTRPEQLHAMSAHIARLKAERDYVAKHLDLVVVRSPIRGIVTTPKPKEKLGQFVEQGELIMEVYDLAVVVAEIQVPEKEIGEVRPGQSVSLKARAYPGREFTGTVRSVAPVARPSKSGVQRQIVRVLTEIDNAALALKPGMSGFGKISGGRRRVIDLITRRLLGYIRVEFWSWW